jgi:hypothetical protein
VCLLWAITATGQNNRRTVWNLPTYDKKPLHFGFVLGMNTLYFSMLHADNFLLNTTMNEERESVYGVETSQSMGFQMGGLSNFRLNETFDVRALFILSFSQRNLDYLIRHEKLSGEVDWYTQSIQIESIYTQFPVLLKMKAKRIGNYRPYLIGGINPYLDLAGKGKKKTPNIEIGKLDLFYEAGFGVDFYLYYFKFSTEFKYSFGTNNLLRTDETQYTQSIGKLYSHMFSVSLNFE